MNPDLYTDEFRAFKFLKSSQDSVRFYKQAELQFSLVQPWTEVNDTDFRWETRLEFVEQLLDLANDTVYIVEPGMLYNQEHRQIYDYEIARLHEIINPVVYEGLPIPLKPGRIATFDDIPAIEDIRKNTHYYFCPRDLFVAHPNLIDAKVSGQIFNFDNKTLIPSGRATYSAFFYDKGWAEKYQHAITTFLRKQANAVSAITSLF